jgi:SAM-dependent methyltransferase
VEATALVDQSGLREVNMIDVPADWYRSLFSGLFLDFWSAVPTGDQDRTEADFLVKTLGVAPPAKMLDVPCGNGRLAVELAGRGFRMTGVDLADYVQRGRSRAAERALAVEIEQRDMRDLPWTSEFDAAYCFGNSFGYFDDDGNLAFLRAVARVLKPGAPFVVEYDYAAETLLPQIQPNRWMRFGEYLYLQRSEYDAPAGRYLSEITVQHGSKSQTSGYAARVYTLREFLRMLEMAGFENCEAFGSLAAEPFKLGAQRLFVAARKQ